MSDADTPACGEALLEFAVDVARKAGALTLEHFNSTALTFDTKDDGTEVTDADRGAEQLVRDLIAQRFADDAVFGEEFGEQRGAHSAGATRARRTWIVDPIDGTRGFVRGVPLYATLLALVEDDQALLGVIHLPALDLTLAAGRGAGCWLGQHKARVSEHGALDRALINTSDFNTFTADQFETLRSRGAMLRTWGDAYGYFLVATGNAEAMIDPVCETWDLAPMGVILTEAGGTFSDFAGTPSFRSRCGVATNGRLHAELLRCLNGDSLNDRLNDRRANERAGSAR